MHTALGSFLSQPIYCVWTNLASFRWRTGERRGVGGHLPPTPPSPRFRIKTCSIKNLHYWLPGPASLDFQTFRRLCLLHKVYPKSYKYWQSVLWLIETCKDYVICISFKHCFFLSVCKNYQNGNFLLKVDCFSDRIPRSAAFSWIILMTSSLLTNLNVSCRNSGRKRRRLHLL